METAVGPALFYIQADPASYRPTIVRGISGSATTKPRTRPAWFAEPLASLFFPGISAVVVRTSEVERDQLHDAPGEAVQPRLRLRFSWNAKEYA